MFLKNILALAILFAGVKSRHVHGKPTYLVEEANILNDNYDDLVSDNFFHSQPRHVSLDQTEVMNSPADYNRQVPALEEGFPVFEQQPSHIRLARQAQGKIDVHIPDQSMDISGSVPLTGSDKNALSAIGQVSGIKPGSYGSAGVGLAVDNINGHSLAVMKTQVPNHGDTYSAAGKLNLVNTPDHKLDAGAFAARTLTTNSQIPNFNTYGGNLDYMYKNKVGASLGTQHIPTFHQTDYSAMGKLNIFRTPSSSLDFSSGIVQRTNPFQSFSQPQFDFVYSRSF